MEMKNYANFSLAAIYNDLPLVAPPAPACRAAVTAVDMATPITGTPKTPGSKITTCNMTAADCTIAP